MSLQSWLQNGWLVQHTTSPEEISNLLAISDRDLAACQVAEFPLTGILRSPTVLDSKQQLLP